MGPSCHGIAVGGSQLEGCNHVQGLALAPPWADPGASVSVVLGLEGAGAREVEVVGLRGA